MFGRPDHTGTQDNSGWVSLPMPGKKGSVWVLYPSPDQKKEESDIPLE